MFCITKQMSTAELGGIDRKRRHLVNDEVFEADDDSVLEQSRAAQCVHARLHRLSVRRALTLLQLRAVRTARRRVRSQRRGRLLVRGRVRLACSGQTRAHAFDVIAERVQQLRGPCVARRHVLVVAEPVTALGA